MLELFAEFFWLQGFAVLSPGEEPAFEFLEVGDGESHEEGVVGLSLEGLGFVPEFFFHSAGGGGGEAEGDVVVGGAADGAEAVAEVVGDVEAGGAVEMAGGGLAVRMRWGANMRTSDRRWQ